MVSMVLSAFAVVDKTTTIGNSMAGAEKSCFGTCRKLAVACRLS